MSDDQLLREIRDLLRDIKAQNEAMMTRNVEHMQKSHEMAERSMAQNTQALGGMGWLKWGVVIFMALLLMIFAVPVVTGLMRTPL
jgi:hypothetical protein